MTRRFRLAVRPLLLVLLLQGAFGTTAMACRSTTSGAAAGAPHHAIAADDAPHAQHTAHADHATPDAPPAHDGCDCGAGCDTHCATGCAANAAFTRIDLAIADRNDPSPRALREPDSDPPPSPRLRPPITMPSA